MFALSFFCQRRGVIAFALLFALTANVSAEVNWHRSTDEALQSARVGGKPILVYVSTSWCHYCKTMSNGTWTDQSLMNLVNQRFIPLALDGDRDTAVVQRLKVAGYPVTILFTPEGAEIARHPGHVTPEVMQVWIENSVPQVANPLRTARR